MTFDEFCTEFYNLLPQCTIQEEESGELVIFTSKRVKRSATEVDEVVDLDNECICADCRQVTKPDKVIEPDLAPVNDIISYHRLQRFEERLNKLECTLSAMLNGGDCIDWEVASERASLEYYNSED